MLLAVGQGTFDIVCHACGHLVRGLSISQIQVTELSGTTSAVSHQFHFECPICSAGEAFPIDHSPLVQEIQRQRGYLTA